MGRYLNRSAIRTPQDHLVSGTTLQETQWLLRPVIVYVSVFIPSDECISYARSCTRPIAIAMAIFLIRGKGHIAKRRH